MASTEVERHTGVDVEEVPSAEWGWSKENPRVIQLGGLLGAQKSPLRRRGSKPLPTLMRAVQLAAILETASRLQCSHSTKKVLSSPRACSSMFNTQKQIKFESSAAR